MSVVYCFIAVVLFSAFYLLVGRNQKRGGSPAALNLVAFAAGTVISAAGLSMTDVAMPVSVAVTGAGIGVFAGVGLLGIAMAVRSGLPLSVVNTVASLSLVVPVLLAFILYRESPPPRQSLGLVCAGGAIVLIQKRSR